MEKSPILSISNFILFYLALHFFEYIAKQGSTISSRTRINSLKASFSFLRICELFFRRKKKLFLSCMTAQRCLWASIWFGLFSISSKMFAPESDARSLFMELYYCWYASCALQQGFWFSPSSTSSLASRLSCWAINYVYF